MKIFVGPISGGFPLSAAFSTRSDSIGAARAAGVASRLDQFDRLGSGPEQAELLAQLQQTALDLESDSRVSVASERPTDRSRMRSLAATLRGLAGSIR